TRQENTTHEQFVELAGRSAAELGVQESDIVEGFLRVRKDHISGVFEYPAEEGVVPQDRAKAAEVLQKVFEATARFPFLQPVFDPVEIFKETIRQYGLHNLEDFVRRGVTSQATILADDQVREARAKGQIVPYPTGRERGRPNQGVRESEEGLTLNG